MSGYYRRRFLLLLAIAAATTLFVLVGRWAGIPSYPKYEVALCTMPAPAARLAIVLVTLVAAIALGTLIAGGVRREISLFAAAVGLCSLSMRSGPMHYVWLHEEISGLNYRLSVELAALGAAIIACWATLTLRAPKVVPSTESRGKVAPVAFAIHFVVTGLLIALLLASDAKKQAIVGIALASCIGSFTASLSASDARLGYWVLTPPILLGILGYLFAGHVSTAHSGFFDALLRAAPLDYAGAGTAGAIFGRWLSVSAEPDAQPASETSDSTATASNPLHA
jgi:hypothetical protein